MNIPEVTNDEALFGASNLDRFPKYNDIPKEFKEGHTKWSKLFDDWFFCGLKKLELKPKEGVDKNEAMRYINAHMRTWKSKHEHKEAGIAYILSQWFDDVTWEKGEKDN